MQNQHSRLPPQVCILTPSGRGAVATVAVRGADAAGIVGKRFSPNSSRALESIAAQRVVVGKFRLTGAAAEELVVGVVEADAIEIHCHGGEAAAGAIRQALIDEGCVPVTWQEWLAREEVNPFACDALEALAGARTRQTAAILLDQYRGALANDIEQIRRLIADRNCVAAAHQLDALLTRALVGLHLAQPWKIVLAGQPNVGKSSLLNAIVGYERAIVFPQAGTTRDVLAATTALEGWPVDIIDTAGLRESGDALEAAGVSRARQEIQECDLVLLVRDAAAISSSDDGLVRELQMIARRLVVVHNKSDLVARSNLKPDSGTFVSAKTGAGIEALCRLIAECLIEEPVPPGAAVPFTADQVSALRQARGQLADNQPAAAEATLETLCRSCKQ